MGDVFMFTIHFSLGIAWGLQAFWINPQMAAAQKKRPGTPICIGATGPATGVARPKARDGYSRTVQRVQYVTPSNSTAV